MKNFLICYFIPIPTHSQFPPPYPIARALGMSNGKTSVLALFPTSEL